MATYVYVYSVAAVIPMATMVLKCCNNDSQACHKSRTVQSYSAGRVSFLGAFSNKSCKNSPVSFAMFFCPLATTR